MPYTLKEISKELDNEYDNLHDQAEQLSVLQDDLFNVKADMTIGAVVTLLKKLDSIGSDVVSVLTEKEKSEEGYENELCKTLKSTIAEAISAFSKIAPPTVTVGSPQINIDLKAIADTNKTLISLIEKINNGNKSDELIRLLMAVANKQLAFLEKSFEQIDIRPNLNLVIDTLNNNRTEKLIVNRDNNFRISEVVPIYKNKS